MEKKEKVEIENEKFETSEKKSSPFIVCINSAHPCPNVVAKMKLNIYYTTPKK